MTARADYFRRALSRAESNRILLGKVSAIPFSNDKDRMKIIQSAKEMQSRIQMSLAQLAIEKPKSWMTSIQALGCDLDTLEDTLEKIWLSPLNSHSENSSHTNRLPGN